MRCRTLSTAVTLCTAVGALAACGAGRVERTSAGDVALTPRPMLETVVGAWPSGSKLAANPVIAKYGAPDE